VTLTVTGADQSLTGVRVNNLGNLAVAGGRLTTDGLTVNNGTLDIGNGGTLALTAPTFTNSGLLSGTGTLDTQLTSFTNAGSIAPGGLGSAGRLTILGDVTFTPTSNLQIDILGNSSSLYDVLDVSGPVNLDGTLTAVLSAGQASAVRQLTPLRYGTYNGEFANLIVPAGMTSSYLLTSLQLQGLGSVLLNVPVLAPAGSLANFVQNQTTNGLFAMPQLVTSTRGSGAVNLVVLP